MCELESSKHCLITSFGWSELGLLCAVSTCQVFVGLRSASSPCQKYVLGYDTLNNTVTQLFDFCLWLPTGDSPAWKLNYVWWNHCIWATVLPNLDYGRGSHAFCKTWVMNCMYLRCVCEPHPVVCWLKHNIVIKTHVIVLVKIKRYSVAYFDRVTAFEAL